MSNPNVTELTDANYKEFVANSTLPVLLDFWAPWCGPCRSLAPVIEEIATENVGKFAIAKANTDQCQAAAAEFGIRSIPTLIFFKNGVKADQNVGALGKSEIVRRLTALA